MLLEITILEINIESEYFNRRDKTFLMEQLILLTAHYICKLN